jgi:hypothetical protein
MREQAQRNRREDVFYRENKRDAIENGTFNEAEAYRPNPARESGGGGGGGRSGTSLQSLGANRQKYIDKLQTVLKTPANFSMYPKTTLADSEMMSGGLLHDTAPGQLPFGSTADHTQQPVMDMLRSRAFMFPETDILAYGRRIETSQSYRHSPVYGF